MSLLTICLAVYLPGLLSIPAVDRDEARFAQASRQMFESAVAGEWRGLVVPRVQERERLNKPPLIYWLQAGSAAVFTGGRPERDSIWMYRVPSVIAGVVAVMGTYWVGRMVYRGEGGRRVAWLAGALLAVCPVVAWETHQARSDMVLLAWTVGAMGFLWRVWEGRERTQWRSVLGLWVCVAGGVMTKGPITPGVVVLAALAMSALQREWKWLVRLRWEVGLLVVAAAVAPWVWAVGEAVGWDRYVSIVRDEVLGRSVSAKEGHWGPPGYHTLLMLLLFWPGSLLVGLSLVRAWKLGVRAGGWRGGRWGGRDAELFLMSWIVPGWIVMEAVSTKLPHYTMPLYPALAIVTARGVYAAAGGALSGLRTWFTRVAAWVWGGATAAVVIGAGAAVVYVGRVSMGVLIAFVGAVVAARAMRGVQRGRWLMAQDFGILAAMLFGFAVMGIVLPRLPVWTSVAVAEVVREVDGEGARPLGMMGYEEDSLVFETRGRAERIVRDGLTAWVVEHPDGMVLLRRGVEVPAVDGVRSESLGEFRGFNYSKGKVEELVLWGLGSDDEPAQETDGE